MEERDDGQRRHADDDAHGRRDAQEADEPGMAARGRERAQPRLVASDGRRRSSPQTRGLGPPSPLSMLAPTCVSMVVGGVAAPRR